jgi:hypothetical protein
MQGYVVQLVYETGILFLYFQYLKCNVHHFLECDMFAVPQKIMLLKHSILETTFFHSENINSGTIT